MNVHDPIQERNVTARGGKKSLFFVLCCLSALVMVACSNDPYPGETDGLKVRYFGFGSPPKTLDPAVAYEGGKQNEIVGGIYEPLLGYHYLKRPYVLESGVAKEVPKAVKNGDGTVTYTFNLHENVRFKDDPCFGAFAEGVTTRTVTAADFEFQFKRIADPSTTSPMLVNFKKIKGFEAFSNRIRKMRSDDPAFAALPINEQYQKCGPLEGIVVKSDLSFDLVLGEAYPQILYWAASTFVVPVAWEAVVYYTGKDGRDHFKDHPVGTGPYYLSLYDKEYKIVLDKNHDWWGVTTASEFTRYPSEGEEGDAVAGYLNPRYVGKTLAFIDRFEFRIEKEGTSSFAKFMQGYNDASGISKEKFDSVYTGGGLSQEMADRGIVLRKTASPLIEYMGFNMLDDVIGQPGGERAKYLRQAMSLVVDSNEFNEIFSNGRNIAAHSPIPPGIYGYDPQYRNPYRVPNFEKAKELLVKAGYPLGVDPETGKALEITLDVQASGAASLMGSEFYVSAWRQLGLNVIIKPTQYNELKDKIKRSNFQIFMNGWVADYPDPENFLFLLQGSMGETKFRGPNTSNYASREYDELLNEMKVLENSPRRMELIRKLIAIIEDECPWVPLSFREDFSLSHSWLYNNKPMGLMIPLLKYLDIDVEAKRKYIAEYNKPITWPAYVALLILLSLIIPGFVTFFKERQ